MAAFVVNLVLALCALLIFFFGCVMPNPPPPPRRTSVQAFLEHERRRHRAMGEMVRSPAAREIERAHAREIALANARAQALANAEDIQD